MEIDKPSLRKISSLCDDSTSTTAPDLSDSCSSSDEDIPLDGLKNDISDVETGAKEAKNLQITERFIYSYRELKRQKTFFFVRREYINYHYRAHEQMTAIMCLKSLFILHNETMNILSHIIPGIYFAL